MVNLFQRKVVMATGFSNNIVTTFPVTKYYGNHPKKLFKIIKYKSAKKPDKCPECGSDKIADILYGLPAFSASLREKIEDHKIVLGGCCVSGNDPTWVCVACNTKIYRMKIDFDDSVN